MLESQNLVKEYHALLWGQCKLNVIEKYFSSDVIIHSPLKPSLSLNDMIEVISTWFSAFPDLNVSWDDYICEGDKVVCQWHAKGVHEGEFLGHVPTQRPIQYSGVTIYRIEENKIKEYWAYVDMDHIRKQLSM